MVGNSRFRMQFRESKIFEFMAATKGRDQPGCCCTVLPATVIILQNVMHVMCDIL